MASVNTSGAINRITKEIANIQKGSDASLAIACKDEDVRHCKALIVGPPETPYEYGFFEFDLTMNKDYPIKSPNVRCTTTNDSKTRFNPNIYADGKVCLSILGTWRGSRGEEWSSAQGLESVLLSIQSLMSSNPYENEPGYEDTKKESDESKAYAAKIRHETLRISVIERLEILVGLRSRPTPAGHAADRRRKLHAHASHHTPYEDMDALDDASDLSASSPDSEGSAYEYDAEATYNALDSSHWDPFADFLKRRFLMYFDTYKKSVETFSQQQKDGAKFETMPFEYPANEMRGAFAYKDLDTRLSNIHEALEAEVASWVEEGADQVKRSTQLSSQLNFQFQQLEYQWNKKQYPGTRMEVSLADPPTRSDPKSPFAWKLTLFGRPSANLDGGIFNMTLTIPPDFPNTQPRVKVETPIFHRQVNSIGFLCYFPAKPEEIGSHLEAIVAAFDDENPVYDPRVVANPDAFELFWGGDDKRKLYNRRLRRSAQQSSEY